MKMPLASVDASPAGHYLNWGVIHISLTNALIVLAMVVVFALAILLPFPRHHEAEPAPSERGAS